MDLVCSLVFGAVLSRVENNRLQLMICLIFLKFEGFLCNCVLPASLNDTKVRQVRAEDYSNTDKKLRTRSNRFASTSKPQPQVTSRSSSSSTTKTNVKPLTTNKCDKK